MKKTIGAVLAVVLLTLGVTAAQQPAAPKDAKAATGSMPADWKARLDDVNARPDAVSVAAEKESLTFTSGPAGIYYKPDMKAAPNLHVAIAMLPASAAITTFLVSADALI